MTTHNWLEQKFYQQLADKEQEERESEIQRLSKFQNHLDKLFSNVAGRLENGEYEIQTYSHRNKPTFWRSFFNKQSYSERYCIVMMLQYPELTDLYEASIYEISKYLTDKFKEQYSLKFWRDGVGKDATYFFRFYPIEYGPVT